MSEFYYKKTKADGTVGQAVTLASAKGIVCCDFPYRVFADPKDLPSNDWADENGKDVYMPDTRKLQSYDIEVEFAYKGDAGSAASSIKSFLNELSGADGKGTDLTIYDSYTGIGRQKVVFAGYSNDMYVKELVTRSTTKNEELVTFKVKFTINDPVTNITYKYEDNTHKLV